MPSVIYTTLDKEYEVDHSREQVFRILEESADAGELMAEFELLDPDSDHDSTCLINPSYIVSVDPIGD